MTKIVETIASKDFTSAKNLVNEKLQSIAERKMMEVKKMIAAKKVVEQEQDFVIKHQTNDRRERLKREITEETEELNEDKLGPWYKHDEEEYAELNKSANKEKSDKLKSKIKAGHDKLAGPKGDLPEETEELDEHGAANVMKMGRQKLVKVRIRGGKIQRRKKVSGVKGMTIRGGKMIRMSPAERRHRKLGARKAKLKRRGKMSMIKRKRKMSMAKRHRMGL